MLEASKKKVNFDVLFKEEIMNELFIKLGGCALIILFSFLASYTTLSLFDRGIYNHAALNSEDQHKLIPTRGLIGRASLYWAILIVVLCLT